ncbi:MAG: hypothetical protein U0V73_00120 [Acidimicrobiia bacterium]
MPAVRTEITEIVTGLGMLGFDDLDAALAERPPQLGNVDGDVWARLVASYRDGRYRVEFAAAWANGTAFLRAAEGLRGRVPLLVEWKGPHRAPGDEVVPADLRVDHVYLVSCKYLSGILINASPAHLFDRCLRGGHGLTARDWYEDVAPDAYQALYELVRSELMPLVETPAFVTDLTPADRRVLKRAVPSKWSPKAELLYRSLAAAVAQASAERWRASMPRKVDREAMLWRLLRIGSAPYFVLGATDRRSLRLRVDTPWDWRRRFDLRRFDAAGEVAGQPVVRWQATVRDRAGGGDHLVAGHVEIRWSHGRFSQPPEAKVYLDTPHHRVPGYVPVA